MDVLAKLRSENLKTDLPEFRAGDTIRVHVKIKEGDKERTQLFEGVVIRCKGQGKEATFTVRKVSYGVGVERIFPLHSPSIAKIEVMVRGRVRRSRIYYFRNLSGKKARIRGEDVYQKATEETQVSSSEQVVVPDVAAN